MKWIFSRKDLVFEKHNYDLNNRREIYDIMALYIDFSRYPNKFLPVLLSEDSPGSYCTRCHAKIVKSYISRVAPFK